MNNVISSLIVAGGLLMFATLRSGADDAKPPPTLDRDAIRQQLQNLSPEERRAKIQELRQQHGAAAATNRPALKQLTPDERRARLRQIREQHPEAVKQLKGLSPEERQAKIKEKLDELKAKKANGTITPVEQALLDRLEGAAQHLQDRKPNAPAEKTKENPTETK